MSNPSTLEELFEHIKFYYPEVYAEYEGWFKEAIQRRNLQLKLEEDKREIQLKAILSFIDEGSDELLIRRIWFKAMRSNLFEFTFRTYWLSNSLSWRVFNKIFPWS